MINISYKILLSATHQETGELLLREKCKVRGCRWYCIADSEQTSFDIDSYAHYLHHKYFECNYADGILPLDRWFGTLHDGSEKSFDKMRARLSKKNRRKFSAKT